MASSRYNGIILSLLKGIARLPFPLLFLLSDLLSPILQYIVGYRRKVVRKNLLHAFPEKSAMELRVIERKFYRHLCDISLETAKAWRMKESVFKERMTVSGVEALHRHFAEGRSVILLGMHLNNWEWSSITQRYLKHQYLVVYNPVRGNPEFEAYLTNMRERYGAVTIPVHKSARTLMEFHQKNIPVCLVLGADQRPPAINRFWTNFMNQEACFNLGPEKIAQKANLPVFLAYTKKIGRGRYQMEFIPLIDAPSEMSGDEIMLTYIRSMEHCIRMEPEHYLWSHNRWSQKRPAEYPLL